MVQPPFGSLCERGQGRDDSQRYESILVFSEDKEEIREGVSHISVRILIRKSPKRD